MGRCVYTHVCSSSMCLVPIIQLVLNTALVIPFPLLNGAEKLTHLCNIMGVCVYTHTCVVVVCVQARFKHGPRHTLSTLKTEDREEFDSLQFLKKTGADKTVHASYTHRIL